MKKMGRRHRPFFRICAMDTRSPRDGRVIEELGYYDPMVKETDARAVLNGERVDYWLSVGAKPSENVHVLIKKYGTNGTHLDQQQAALERVKASKPTAPPPKLVPKKEEPVAEAAAATEAEAPAAEESAPADAPTAEAAPVEAADATATDEAASDAATEEKPAESAE
jgi:small subunit ribosomal protein S16